MNMLRQEEHDEMRNGWPLGLENMNMKLRVPSDQIQTTGRNSLRVPSSRFSSLSSSNLDTESSASFFQDHSVSLGRMIGMRHGDGGRGRLYFPNTNHLQNDGQSLLDSEASRADEMEISCGICVPQFYNIMVKMNRSKSSPRH